MTRPDKPSDGAVARACNRCRSRVYLGIAHTCPDATCYYHVPIATTRDTQAGEPVAVEYRIARFAESDPVAYVKLRGPVNQFGESEWQRKAELYDHMQEVVAAAGFDSITQAIARDTQAVEVFTGAEIWQSYADNNEPDGTRYVLATDYEASQREVAFRGHKIQEGRARILAAESYIEKLEADLEAMRARAEAAEAKYRWLCENLAMAALLMHRDQYATPQRCVEALMPLDTAEQERCE
jgi:hypothetical protein